MTTALDTAQPRQEDHSDHSGEELRQHVAMLHRLAEGLTGKLILTRFGEDPEIGKKCSPLVRHFEIGDINGMAAAVRQLGAERDRNVYVPLAVLRPDLPKAQKGFERDVVAVLGIVADFDDKAAADYEARLPLPLNYVLETSPGRFQCFYLLSHRATVAQAKPVAEALKRLCGCDHGTADMSHVWRVPGTLNWPTKRKLDAGRPREGVPVRVVQPWDGSLTSLAELRDAIEAAGGTAEPEAPEELTPNGKANGAAGNGQDHGATEWALGFMALPEGLRRRIVEPTPEGERSENAYFVIAALIERDWSDAKIEALIRAHPAGVGARYEGRNDLAKEIARVRRKGEKREAKPGRDKLARLEQSDTGNADRLLARFGGDLLFTTHAGWHAWDGQRWQKDERQQAVKLAQRTARLIFEECKHLADKEDQERRAKWAVASQNKGKIEGMLAMAAPHRMATPDDLDSDPWRLNVANGTIDLRTGKPREHDRGDLITKLAPIEYDPAARAPAWIRFLEEIFCGDQAMIRFVQRAAGYSLTGDTCEQVMFILHGSGSNGKSTLLEILATLAGEYGQQTPTETFMVKDRAGGIPNDVARLRGARFVSAVETERDRRLAESLVKQATGGDRMTGRFLHQEFFEFTPAFKLWLGTNHKPEVRGTDDAIWRRLRLIPFNVKFWRENDRQRPKGAPLVDKGLKAKLLAELPGILAWAVRGCLEWQRDGLAEPEAVLAATAAYRSEMDRLGDFLADECDIDPAYSIRASELFGAYRTWAASNGEEPMSQTAFGRAMTDRGFRKDKSTYVVYRGLTMREPI